MSPKSHLLDVHPRKTLIESFYVEHLHSTTRFLVAQPEDLTILLNYIEDEDPEFLSSNSVDNFADSLNQSLVIMVTDCFEVCGLIVGRLLTRNDNENLLELKNGKMLHLSLLNVCKEYRNANIETELLKELLKLAQKSEIELATTSSQQIIQLCEQLKASSKLKLTESSNAKQLAINLKEEKDFMADEPPSLPKAYQLPNVKRRVLGQHPAKPLGRSLEYVVAVPEDEELVKDFLCNEYFRQTAVTRTLQCRKSDGAELITRFRPEVLQQGMVFMAHDQGRLCGLCINRFIKVDHSGPRLDENIPEDFTPEIEKQQLSHLGSRAIRALCRWMDDLTPQMLPNDCNEYFLLDILTVQPGYRGCKIGWKLWYESLKYSQQLGYQYTQTICTAIASNNLATKFGLRKMIEFPYVKLTYKGQKLFEDGTVYDGGKRICLYIGKSEELTLDS